MHISFTTRTLVFCMLLLAAPVSLIAQQRVIVTDCDLQGWVKNNPNNVNTLEFREAPASVPVGKGSLYFKYPGTPRSFIRLRNTDYDKTLLSAVTAFSYDTYVQARSNNKDAPFLVLQIDANGDNTIDENLVFNPYFQVPSYTGPGFPNQGPTQTGTWQSWDLLNGGWWSSLGPDPDNNGVLFSLAAYISRNPNARIMNNPGTGPTTGGIRLTAGSTTASAFGGGFEGYADRFIIGINGRTKLYDFEYTDKIALCHNNETICVAAASVPAHLAHGDQLGSCPDQLRVNTVRPAFKEVTDEIKGFSFFPNPLQERGQLQFILSSNAFVEISLCDNTGKKVRDIAGGFRTAGRQQVTLDRNGMAPGLYHIRLKITSGNEQLQQTAKLLISR